MNLNFGRNYHYEVGYGRLLPCDLEVDYWDARRAIGEDVITDEEIAELNRAEFRGDFGWQVAIELPDEIDGYLLEAQYPEVELDGEAPLAIQDLEEVSGVCRTFLAEPTNVVPFTDTTRASTVILLNAYD